MDFLNGLFNPNMSFAPTTDMSALLENTNLNTTDIINPQNMSMATDIAANNMENVMKPFMEQSSLGAFGPQSLVAGGTNVPAGMEQYVADAMKYNAQNNGGLFDSMMNNTKDFFKNAGLKEYGQLANLGGDLYNWKLKKGLYDEQIANSKQARQIAADEKKRKDDFIRITSGNYYT